MEPADRPRFGVKVVQSGADGRIQTPGEHAPFTQESHKSLPTSAAYYSEATGHMKSLDHVYLRRHRSEVP